MRSCSEGVKVLAVGGMELGAFAYMWAFWWMRWLWLRL